MTKRKREDPSGLQFKSFGFDTKSVAQEPDADGFVYIEAYGSVFDNVDSHNDMIVKGAYAETLKAWAAKGAPIPSYYNHGAFSNDPHDNVGYLAVAEEDSHGLKVRMALDVEHNPKAAYAHRLIKQDRLRELSVGYIAKSWELIHEEGKREWEYTRKLTAIDLLEVSVVSIASNSLATVTEKAAALLYGGANGSKADDAVDDDADGTEEPAGDATEGEPDTDAAAESLAEAAEALALAVAAVEAATAALAGTDEDSTEEDPAGDPDDDTDDSGEPAGAKSLSARARVALAMIAASAADTE